MADDVASTTARALALVAPPAGKAKQRLWVRLADGIDGAALVGVSAGENATYFFTGVGRKATVTVRGGEPSCVIGGWFAG